VRLVHLADLHLGFRQFQRLTPAGINQREADVAAAFRRTVDAIIALRPDLVLVAGDVFHAVRPPNPAILHAFNNINRLVSALPGSLVVMVAGNHDTPRSSETVCILRLFRQLGVFVVDSGPSRLQFPERDLSILAVPDIQDNPPAFTPDAGFRHNVLVMHGEIRGVIPRHAAADDRPALQISVEELKAPKWSYIALGDYHVFREIAPNAFYSGALEYTSSNPWGELKEQKENGIPGKGFLEYDLNSATHNFHPVPGVRAHADLPALSARGLTSLELDELIAQRVDECPGGIDDKVVRLVVRDVPRHIARELDHAAIRGYKRRALQFLLDTRRPEVVRTSGSGAPPVRRSLAETVRDKLRSRQLESDMDKEALVELGLAYLREADAADAVLVETEV
jgi:DNA repair exonuclease SbcCD nuclease subunit